MVAKCGCCAVTKERIIPRSCRWITRNSNRPHAQGMWSRCFTKYDRPKIRRTDSPNLTPDNYGYPRRGQFDTYPAICACRYERIVIPLFRQSPAPCLRNKSVGTPTTASRRNEGRPRFVIWTRTTERFLCLLSWHEAKSVKVRQDFNDTTRGRHEKFASVQVDFVRGLRAPWLG